MNTIISIVIILVFLVGIFAIYVIFKSKNVISSLSMGVVPDKKTNFFLTFLVMLLVACGVVYFLKQGLESGSGTLNNLLFIVLPYIAIAIFLIGTIYRYSAKGYQVSSLSSQFLEGKQLFWGSQPFHWGLLFLFFGHLVAFLFPSSVIAWNGTSVRLLILEMSALAFSLAAFLGLILLIRRRLASSSIKIVSHKMDMLVYVVLLTQIISGIGVAVFARFGSSWFAGVLTPYLRSVFALNPEINAVSAMPWMIQIHIVSAFFIIAIIPFTRFVHFLVAPIDYIWRSYQVVIWNWNKNIIRDTNAYFPGKKPKNH